METESTPVWHAGRRFHYIVLLIPAMVLALQAARCWPFCMDDVFISLRYARNLANGLGPVFNAGEHVEGFSNPAFVMLVALLGRLGMPYLLTSKAVGLVAALGATTIVYLTVSRVAGTRRALVAALLLGGHLPFAAWAVSGLETSLYTLSLIVAVWFLVSDRPASAGGAMGFAALCRPEAPLLAAALLPLWGRKRARPYILGASLVLVPYIAVRLIYYQDLLPNTFYAKLGGAIWERLPAGVEYIWNAVAGQGVLWLAASMACLACGISTQHARLKIACLALGVAEAAFAVYTGGDWMPCSRLLVPAAPAFFVLLVVSAPRPMAPLLAVVLPTGLSGPRSQEIAARVALHERNIWGARAAWRQAGVWLERHAAGQWVAASQIGYMPWCCPSVRFIDLVGLTDRTIAHSPGRFTEKCLPRYVAERKPGYVVLALSRGGPLPPSERAWWARRAEWLARYRPVVRFPLKMGEPAAVVVYGRDEGTPP